VLTQTAEMQLAPKPELLKPLIEINRNLAAGLSGRA
jgi:flagellar protein FlaF